jgi:hypothetical protein
MHEFLVSTNTNRQEKESSIRSLSNPIAVVRHGAVTLVRGSVGASGKSLDSEAIEVPEHQFRKSTSPWIELPRAEDAKNWEMAWDQTRHETLPGQTTMQVS